MRADNCTSVPRLLFTSINERRKEGVQKKAKKEEEKEGKQGRKKEKALRGTIDTMIMEWLKAQG